MQPFGPFLNGFYDTADQLREHLRRRADEAFAAHAAQKAALSSRDDFLRRTATLKQELLASIGGLPDIAAEVKGTVTGTLDTDTFVVEKLLLETLPDTYATANLYLPKGKTGKVPGVLFLCGHSQEAKAYPTYQRVCRALVRAGMAVLALDPVGQGERLQYLDPQTGEQLVRWGTVEHSHAGFQCHVAGFSVARYFVADAQAALTYLSHRPEVDATKLGVTGNSGGGTQSSYVTFFDERLRASAPCTYITSRDAYMATGQPHDSEQNFYRAITMGLDYDDLLAPHAPKPLLIGAVASDFFCVEGTLQSYERLRRVYDLFESADNLACVIAPGTHQYAPTLRDQVTRFFCKHLLEQEISGPSGLNVYAGPVESPMTPIQYAPADQDVFSPDALQVTKTGQVALDMPGAKRVFDLNVEAWRARSRGDRADDSGEASNGGTNTRTPASESKFDRLRRTVLSDRSRPPLWVREVRSGVDEETGIAWAHRFTFSESRIALPLIELRQKGTDEQGPLTVLALDEGTDALTSRRTDIVNYVNQHGRVLMFDPRGTGAAKQRPINARPEGNVYDTTYKLNYDAMMLGDSLFAMRAFDALRALEYAHRIAPEVSVAVEGVNGLALLAAAALDGRVRSGRFKRLVRSFEEIATDRFFKASHVLEVFGLLDLPDVPELLALLPDAQVEEERGAERAS